MTVVDAPFMLCTSGWLLYVILSSKPGRGVSAPDPSTCRSLHPARRAGTALYTCTTAHQPEHMYMDMHSM